MYTNLQDGRSLFKLIQTLEELQEVYPEVYPYLEQALAVNNEYSLDSCISSILVGDSQLWVAGADEVLGAVVTEVIQYPQCKKMVIHLCAGTGLNEWMQEGLGAIEELAEKSECTAVTIYGRAGWKKLLKDYESSCIVLEKRL